MEGSELQPFSGWLADHRRGALDDELAAALADVVTAVRANGKPGKVRLDISIDRKGRSVVVTDAVVTKIPEPDREAAIYFGDDNGQLHRDDPSQVRLPLETATAETTDGLAVVDTETGELRRVEGEKR